MMFGKDGNHGIKLSWDDYTRWQSWSEWPERKNNPPLTVETVFNYNGQEYMVTSLRHKYVIVTQPDFHEIISSDNMLDLLTMPFIDGKSFKELISKFVFDD